jgi:D-alanyl-D-alanine dipeptidase
MLRKFFVLAAMGLPVLRLMAQPAPPLQAILSQTSQMVVVTTSNWTSSEGVLRRFERMERGWQQTGPSIPVVVGRAGLGWGRGMNPASSSGPQKMGGDGRSPAGVFRLTYAFGYAPADEVPEIRLPYMQCTESVECVEDTNSAYFNIIVDRHAAAKVDWKSAEKMRKRDDEYKLGVFVAHNSAPAEPGAGGCVFLCVWKGAGKPSGGSTEMSIGGVESLLGWLDPRGNPVLVQLPQEEYTRRQAQWVLPAIEF